MSRTMIGIGTLGLSTFIIYMAYSAAFSLCDPQYFAWIDGQCSPQTSVLSLIGMFALISLPLAFVMCFLTLKLVSWLLNTIKAL